MKIVLFGRDGQVATEVRRRVPSGVTLDVLDHDTVDFLKPDEVYDALLGRQADAVINAVAYTQVDKAETDIDRARTINATAVGAMGKGCAETGTPLVHISTDYVFSGKGDRPWKPDDPVDPQSVYGQTKLDGEYALADAQANATILRTSWVFSAHRANFVKTMLRLVEDHDELTVVADQIGGPTPAADIADACLTIAQAMSVGTPGGTFHFSGTDDVSWADFAREIFHQSNKSISIVDIKSCDFPRPAPRPCNSRLDCSTLQEVFGIQRPDWRVGLRNVLDELGV